MKKKILKIVGGFLLLFIVILVAAPFFLEGKIAEIVKNKVNNNINGTLDFEDADLNLFSSFPNAKLRLNAISLINSAPFEGDTLFSADRIDLKMGLTQLFKNASEPIAITSLIIEKANLAIIVDEAENANYDIGKEKGETDTGDSSQSSGFRLALESYEITDSKIRYSDLSTKTHLTLTDLNHMGNGDLSLDNSELDTNTNAFVSFQMDSTNYLKNHKIQLDAKIGIDLKERKYSFLENEALINQLPIVFTGYVKVNEADQEIAIDFKTPSSEFKNFLAVIPEEYSKNIESVKTTGNFEVQGEFKGVVDEKHIPTFSITINSDNASFKYPDLPKSVQNVHIDVAINNTSGIAEDTYVDIKKLSFSIDEDRFDMTSKIVDLLGNTKVNAHVGAKMNLANLSQAYPMPSDLDLKGMLDADVTTAFDMASIERKQYEKTKTAGNMALRDFEYSSEEIPNPVKIQSAKMTFNPNTVTLNEFKGATGKTDFESTGTINNLLGFLFNEEKVEGNFDLKSNTFALNDFMVEETDSEEGTTSEPEEKIKIPSFLDCNINASANTVLYDNLTLKDVSGNLKIKDESAILTNMTSSLFDGKMAFNGEVSTKTEAPVFAMKLGMNGFKIGETFKALELFNVLAPIASALQGKLDSDIELSGNLNDDFTPNLATISGKVLAELLATDINADESKILSSLGNKLNFINSDKLNLQGLKTALSFENGVVKVKPFTINYDDIAIKVAGSHTFDQKLNYTATLDVPAKYLGSEVNSLIAKIDDSELEGLTVPITANIGGAYGSPTVSTDLTSGVKKVTAQLVAVQKQKLVNEGTDAAKDLIGGILGGNSSENDSLEAAESNNGVQEAIGGLLGGGAKTKDTANTGQETSGQEKDALKEAASGILGGLLGKKKNNDDTEKAKDSVN
ncbi:AsmA-like C-terminal region-containing protein [Spongiimicrobium sp. 3-5]|uniref:AsmA-like C-terminal region-containing protein n=1 Tax=Spongiimicrobium sp. 3-5 TaxID=3332596 RepID=UPI0039805766